MSKQLERPNTRKLLLSEDPDDALDKQLQDHIIASLWSSPDRHDSSAYFHYFKKQCEAWRLSGIAVAIQTYQDFLDLVEHLKRCHDLALVDHLNLKHFHNGKRSASTPALLDFFPPLQLVDEKPPPFMEDCTLEQLGMPLKERFPYCDIVSATNSIFLAVRLWVMLNVGSSDIYTFTPGNSSLEWAESQSLDFFVNACFPTKEGRLSQWPYSLHAYNLDRLGGFKIVWTDHLGDHLYLNEDLGTIHIYHHVQVLRGLLGTGSPLSQQLIIETLQTLTLLIPRANADCKRWFTKHAKAIDEGAGDVEPLRWARSPEKYIFWGHRLEMIRLAYDESNPTNLGQWWRDRRNKVQWYTFWVAILVLVLTIVFGLIQSITSVMQVYYAAHAVPSSQPTGM